MESWNSGALVERETGHDFFLDEIKGEKIYEDCGFRQILIYQVELHASVTEVNYFENVMLELLMGWSRAFFSDNG